ncbi:MAG: hypothetical protein KKF77_01195 [Proteobacteria bacterium]|nr:hypothetical protein [Pseudomonadota bacterium]
MTSRSNAKTHGLNERVKRFFSSLSGVEVVDELDLFSKFPDRKRADYLFANRRVIVELKALEADPEGKVQNELEKHKERKEYPLFYGKQELSKILKHLPDGEKINADIYDKVTRSIKQSFRSSDKQIRDTKITIDCSDANGLLVLLNEDINILSPEIIAYSISQQLAKKDMDGTAHYAHVTSAWVISENYYYRARPETVALPSIVIDGPSAVNNHEFSKILDILQAEWAKFNGVPLIKAELGKISDNDFLPLKALQRDVPQTTRQEQWQRQYRTNPTLRSMPDKELLRYGRNIIEMMRKNFSVGAQRPPDFVLMKIQKEITFFFEEVNIRGLNLKDMPK